MVDHDHDRIKTINWREVSDKVNREVLEGVRAFKGNGGDGWDHRMGENLVCLANCTARNIFPDIGGKPRPPVVLGKKNNGAKVTAMATFKETMSDGNQIMVGWFRDVEVSLVVESPIVKGPVFGF